MKIHTATLANNSMLFRKAMEDSLVVGIRAIDLDGQISYVNPAFCRITGFAEDELIGLRPGVNEFATLNALMLDKLTLFIADTNVHDDPTAEQLAEIAALASEGVKRFGLPPKLAFVSHSMFGSSTRPSAVKMRRAHELFTAAHPEVECDGEMHGDAALSETVRQAFLPDSKLSGAANLLVLPSLDSAHILFNVLKVSAGNGVTVGPMLLGAAAPVHILNPSATVRRIVNMTALTVADANANR